MARIHGHFRTPQRRVKTAGPVARINGLASVPGLEEAQYMSNGASVIAEVLASWGGEPHLEREVFATVEPEAIAESIDGFCRSYLGVGVGRYEFFATSVGSVHGCMTRRVWSLEFG